MQSNHKRSALLAVLGFELTTFWSLEQDLTTTNLQSLYRYLREGSTKPPTAQMNRLNRKKLK